ncbi:hypothetical protein GY45DRAFT_1375586 [Cubamyces sp. BRFM 1775]|nr:hypothetical protein GY45DRAFT_1375586 [Cubamyces sp. BRFM 1775]
MRIPRERRAADQGDLVAGHAAAWLRARRLQVVVTTCAGLHAMAVSRVFCSGGLSVEADPGLGLCGLASATALAHCQNEHPAVPALASAALGDGGDAGVE